MLLAASNSTAVTALVAIIVAIVTSAVTLAVRSLNEKSEHAKWLRQERLVAYSTFIGDAQVLGRILPLDPLDNREFQDAFGPLLKSLSMMIVLGPEEVRKVGFEISRSIGSTKLTTLSDRKRVAGELGALVARLVGSAIAVFDTGPITEWAFGPTDDEASG